MAMRKLFFSLLFILSGCVQPNVEAPIEPDPDWVSGQLENGVRFHLYPMEDTEEVSLRLFFHVGSAQETDAQRGYAHFLEHMAFNGSKSLGNDNVIAMFEQAGVTGSDVNAYTSYYETVYELDLPDRSRLDTALVWMRDIADGLTLEEQEIEKEKGVIQGEIRRNRPENRSFLEKYYDHIIADTPLALWDPVGTKESVQNASADSIRDFYQTWYQPQYAQIVISGDITSEEAKALIEAKFASWSANNQASNKRNQDVVLKVDDYVAEVGQYDSPSISVLIDRGTSIVKLRGQQHQLWLDELAQSLIFNRLDREFNDAAIPLQGLVVSSDYINYRRYTYLSAAFAEQERQQAQQLIVSTLAALRDFGVSKQEYQTGLAGYVQQAENLDYNWQQQSSIDAVQSMVASISQSSANQSKADYQRSLDEFLALATPERINQRIQTLLTQEKVLLLAAENDQAVATLTKQLPQLRASFDIAGVKPVMLTAQVDQLSNPLSGGDIVSKEQLPGFTVWTLSNGVEVWFERDKTAGDFVHMVYISQGGKAALDSELYAAHGLAPGVISRSGIGEFSGSEFDAYLTRQSIEVYPFVGLSHHGLEVGTTKKKLADSLNVIFNAVTNAKVDTRQLEVVKREVIEELQSDLETPIGQWNKAINQNSYLPSSFHRMTTAPEVAMVNDEQINQVYQQLFSVNRNNKLVVIADMTEQELEPLIKYYVGAIPLQQGQAAKLLADYQRSPKARVDMPIYNEENSFYLLRSTNPNASITTARLAFIDDMIQRLLAKRLNDYVREELGLDYAPDAYSASLDGEASTDWFIEAQVAPQDIDKIDKAVAKVMQGLLDNVTQQDVDLVAKQLAVALHPLADDPVQRAWFYARYLVHDYGVEALQDVDMMTQSITLDEMRERIEESFGRESLITKYTLTP